MSQEVEGNTMNPIIVTSAQRAALVGVSILVLFIALTSTLEWPQKTPWILISFAVIAQQTCYAMLGRRRSTGGVLVWAVDFFLLASNLMAAMSFYREGFPLLALMCPLLFMCCFTPPARVNPVSSTR